jgi:Mg-chelatase subunit ChlD
VGASPGRRCKKKAREHANVITGDHLHLAEDSELPTKSHRTPKRILSAEEQRLLSHHPGTPADHKHNLNAPLDRKSDRLLREGALDEVISLAEIAPTRVAEAMVRNRLVLEHLHDHAAHDKLVALTWDSLDPELRRQNFKRMLRMILKMARRVPPVASLRDGATRASPYRFHADELEIDASVERLVAEGKPLNGRLAFGDYADFSVIDRTRRPCAYAVMLDESRSMRGSKSAAAALVAAVLLLNLRPDDRFAVTGFSDEARVIRPLGPRKVHERILQDILDIRPGGCTDIAKGLKSGICELNKAGACHRIGILVSDGWLNTGHEPLPLAREFRRLHVIELPGGDHDLCEKMGAAGHGVVTPVRELAEIPSAVKRCLRG